jgi:hypothetical protein
VRQIWWWGQALLARDLAGLNFFTSAWIFFIAVPFVDADANERGARTGIRTAVPVPSLATALRADHAPPKWSLSINKL